MTAPRSMKLWIVNVVSFVILFLLAITGLINWLVLPHGGGRKSWVTETRHFIMDVHAWLAVAFLLAVGIHIWLHWSYIKANLTRYGWFNAKGR
ncbi:hypothetical protein DSCW_29980 [Desulfosarcina widdelii]|uniref:Flavinylation-associated cytochrome domain-containing protein n=1 Tax=Desulfosarcina widdelii TaxID=947919 RepID=A0A5K7Z795_9BACT|nr:DUF4405 domain-containing protein [Desulfosarcina widdelii]BBO75581.1 hypothetical protein DSCW_29980 [Desulfosarcina widdelii]